VDGARGAAARDAAEATAARNPRAVGRRGAGQGACHFADHCASCHGNDGRGQTTLGRNMYPKAPDMTLPETQRLSDGELFAIIENGVRLTGMPAWGSPGPEDDNETWELVHFIRHLPKITPEELDEMKELNPKTKKELEEAIRRFSARARRRKPGATSTDREPSRATVRCRGGNVKRVWPS
jgi:mono/diheme cytochrome c family protein